MKTKKVVNPNLMFTVFTTFGERSPGEIRKDMIDWIESNHESFKLHTFMGMHHVTWTLIPGLTMLNLTITLEMNFV